MDSFLPMGGFQLPFQRRLSRLYNDTKKSSDFVKEPANNEEDPEIKALYRKLRIQKDRFVSWGLEWSDPNQSAEIDESLSRAGLSEVVGSIMSTIKDILAEAEPLWQSSKRVVEGNRPSQDRKAPLVQWDKGRFEDLIRDLTASIDTLYDLSRTRSSGAALPRASKPTLKSSGSGDLDFRPFESTRMQTPQHIDINTLTYLRPLHGQNRPKGMPMYREVVFMSKTAYSELTHGTDRQPWAPLLLEYANFDPIYSTTGIMPSMARFEKLSAGLQQNPQRAPGTWTGLPRLLGYFEDMENSRLGLIYRFPPSFNAVSFDGLTQNPTYNLPTLGDVLSCAGSEPPLEAKFRLAHNLTNTIFDLHARGITHGNLMDMNISFCGAAASDNNVIKGGVDVRRPLLSAFDVFPEDFPASTIWRHPLDPRSKSTSPLSRSTDERVLELYPLAMVLVSIGLWTNLDALVVSSGLTSPILQESTMDSLAVKCGSLYMKAVKSCWLAVDDEISGRASGETLLSGVQTRVSRFLEACCILDGVSGLEERLGQEPSATDATSYQASSSIEIPIDSKRSQSVPTTDTKKPFAPPIPSQSKEVETVEQLGKQYISQDSPCVSYLMLVEPLPKDVIKSEAKMRLYPHVPLPTDIVEKWNSILMPQINTALRSFYRKHPESVEISLESVGPSPHQTRPTVLVVCTSVGKVRAILNKRLGELFDETTGFALKVCRGHVLRSRRLPKPAQRSMGRASKSSSGNHSDDGSDADGDGEVEAVNPEYQERPGNGASIGAWIGDRHLPPVSFGGLVMVDDKPYGMTVHHMLDDPDRDFGIPDTMRSSGIPGREWFAESTVGSVTDGDFSYELSDTESEPYSETDLTSDDDDDEEEDGEYEEPGDIPGIEPGCGEGYIVTQPALDDVEEGFYPCAETEDEDHIDTFSLGEVYASSGIRRKQANGLVHEVDWALFEFADGRVPDDNLIPKAQNRRRQRSRANAQKAGEPMHILRPTTVAPWASLPGLEVQCIARTSGLQEGRILPALTSVKIYGRTSPSHTYQVASTASPAGAAQSSSSSTIPLGIPGDSGAWVVDSQQGHLCGHVLAWSQRKRVAYICPMDVLFLDIAQTLEATEVRLPGGEPVITLTGRTNRNYSYKTQGVEDEDLDDLVDEEGDEDDDDTAPSLVNLIMTGSPHGGVSSHSLDNNGSSSPLRLDVSTELQGITKKLDEVGIGGHGMGVDLKA